MVNFLTNKYSKSGHKTAGKKLARNTSSSIRQLVAHSLHISGADVTIVNVDDSRGADIGPWRADSWYEAK